MLREHALGVHVVTLLALGVTVCGYEWIPLARIHIRAGTVVT